MSSTSLPSHQQHIVASPDELNLLILKNIQSKMKILIPRSNLGSGSEEDFSKKVKKLNYHIYDFLFLTTNNRVQNAKTFKSKCIRYKKHWSMIHNTTRMSKIGAQRANYIGRTYGLTNEFMKVAPWVFAYFLLDTVIHTGNVEVLG